MEEFKVKATLDIKDATAKLNKMTSEIKGLSSQMKKGSVSSKQYSHSIAILTKGLRSYISAYAAIRETGELVRNLTELQNGFIAIQKTTNLAGSDMERFSSDLVDLAQKMKGVTVKQLQDIAAVAGQLGIHGSKNLLSFSEAIAKIAIATNLTAEEAAKGMAIFTNIMDIPIQQVGRLGSVMNELSNTSTATSSVILEFSKRLAGAGKNLGLTGYQVMGLAATLSDIGSRIESGGTAVSKVLTGMLTHTQDFAKISGQSIEEYVHTLNTKPIEAFKNVINGLKNLDKTARINALKPLKLQTQITTSVLLRMANATGKLTRNLRTAKQEWRTNTSLNKEYAIAADSLGSSIADLQDSFNILLLTLSKDLVPWLQHTINDMTDLILDVKDFSEKNRVLVGTITDIVKEIVGLAAVLRVLKALGIQIAITGIVNALLEMRLATIASAASLEALGTAFNSLALSKAGILLTLITGIVAGLTYEWNYFADAAKESNKNLKDATTLYNRTTKALHNVNNALSKNKELLNITTAERNKQVKKIQDLINSHINEIKHYKSLKDGATKYKNEIAHLTSEIIALSRSEGELEQRQPMDSKYAIIMNTYADAVDKAGKAIHLTVPQYDNYKKVIAETIQEKIKAIDKLKQEFTNRGLNEEAIKRETQQLAKLQNVQKIINNLTPDLKGQLIGLNKEQQKFVDKTAKLAEQRLSVSKNTVVEIKNKETKLYADLAKLAKELQNIRKKYANERVEALDKIQDKLRAAEQKGMTDVQKYNQDQQVADEKYYKAKEALQQNNLELAKKYLSDYYSLVDNYAGEEIKSGKQVAISRSETMAKYREELKKGSSLEQDLISKREAKEIQAHNQKIEMKKIELEATKAELQAQMEIVKLYTQMAQMSGKIKFAPDFKGFQQSISNINLQIKKLENQKRTAKIKVTADTKQATIAIEEVKQKTLKLNGVKLKIDADTTPADFGIDKLITKTEKNHTDITINPKWEEAQKKIDSLRNGEEKKPIKQKILVESKEAEQKITTIKKPTKSIHTVMPHTTVAQNAINRLKRNTSSTHTVYIREVQTKATGGFIQRRNQIPGHDLSGSDNVPALLTKGEFIQNVKAVDYYGVSFMQKLNNLQLPKFATGGLVTNTAQNNQNNGNIVNVNLNVGNKQFQMQSDEQVANALADYLNRAEF